MSKTSSDSVLWPSLSTEGLDRRTRRTKEALINALFTLLRDKPLTAITVTELTSLADVNRATFYTHYQDVYDMYEHLKAELCSICRTMVEGHGTELANGEYLGLIEDIYQFIADNKRVFDVVLSDEALLSTMIPVVREAGMKNAAIMETTKRQLAPTHLSESEVASLCQTVCNYQFDYIAGGVVNILRSWIASGRKESVHDMALLTNACIHSLNPDGTCRMTVDTIKALTR